MTDGNISLYSEGCDGENRGIGGHFGEHTAHDAHGVREFACFQRAINNSVWPQYQLLNLLSKF